MRSQKAVATSTAIPFTLHVMSDLACWRFVPFRAAVLELLCEEIEPQVEHFECVDHPDRLNRPDRCVYSVCLIFEALWDFLDACFFM